MKRRIPHSLPFLGKQEQVACARVIASRQLSQSVEVALLEKELPALIGHRFGAAVSSGTAALYLALRALGVTTRHSVVIPSYSCTALLNAVNFIGARPLLADVDPVTGVITPQSAKKALRKNTKAIIVPHLFGYPADTEGITRLGVPVIEDCAQCVGAKLRGDIVGGHSQATIFSFYATKLIGAGEGGMVTSSNKEIVDRVIALREYDNREKYVPAFNFKLSEIHAAIARVQVAKLSSMLKKRRLLARYYQKRLLPFYPAIELPPIDRSVEPTYFRFVVRCPTALVRDRIITKMDAFGIGCRKPVFLPLHRYTGQKGFPGTDALYERALSLPLYPDLDKKDVDHIVDELENILSRGKGRHGS